MDSIVDSPPIRLWPATIFLILAAACSKSIGADPGETVRTVYLENRAVIESSGIAPSQRKAGDFWTHNDSGDAAVLYRFDSEGKHLSRVELEDAEAIDWEDIASYQFEGESRLIVGDVGDNARRRERISLIEIVEPDSHDAVSAAVRRTWHVRYPDGARDCEGIAIDRQGHSILLCEKSRWGMCTVSRVPLHPEAASGTVHQVVAEPVATIALPAITAMDITADGSAVVLVTYLDAFVFRRRKTDDQSLESWAAVFAHQPIHLPLPLRRQGEAVCFGGLQGDSAIWLTSEKKPTPLMRVELPAAGTAIEK